MSIPKSNWQNPYTCTAAASKGICLTQSLQGEQTTLEVSNNYGSGWKPLVRSVNISVPENQEPSNLRGKFCIGSDDKHYYSLQYCVSLSGQLAT